MNVRILILTLVACLLLCSCGTKESAPATEPATTPATEPATAPSTEPATAPSTKPTLAPSVENGPISMEELLGEWHLDGDYTKEKSGMSLEDFYGALWEEEEFLQFNEDGTVRYKAGICYGNGVFSITENGVMVAYAGDEDEDDAGFNLLTVEQGDVLRIGMDQYGDGNYVYWVKK